MFVLLTGLYEGKLNNPYAKVNKSQNNKDMQVL